MKKVLLVALCAVASVLPSQATEIMNEDFSGYSDGDINSVSGWVASTAGKTNEVVSGELMLATTGDRIVFSGAGTSLAVGERLEVTLDYRVSIPSTRNHYQGFGFGIQDNGIATATNNAQLLNAYVFMFGLEPQNRYSGQVNFFPDNQQWAGPGTYVMMAEADCGMNPFGYYTNEAPYDSAAYIDAGSDVLRSVYTITKSHVANEFNVAVSTSNLTSGAYYTGSDSGIVRPDVWASSDLSLTIHSAWQITNYIQNVKMEKLDVVIAAPTSVSALGLDGEVTLGWDVMPGATQYDVYRTEIPGDYTGVTPVTVDTESHLDDTVSNGTTYYYSIVAKFAGGDSVKSDEVSVTPKKVYVDESVYATADFEALSLGDLAANAEWGEISGSSNNAFAVIDEGGTNKADTVSTVADFDPVVGNAVYLDRLMQNAADDVVEGSFDVVISATEAVGTSNPNVGPGFADFVNWGVMEFGLTSGTTDALAAEKDMMAMFHIKVRSNGKIVVLFGTGTNANDDNSNRLADIGKANAGWNPKDDAWDYVAGSAADLETDPLRIAWKIRKTREVGVYQAWASITNLTSGWSSSDETSVKIEYELKDSQDMYDAPAAIFAMGHSQAANDGTLVSIINATVDEVNVLHSAGNLPVVEAPFVTSVISGDREVSIEWEPVLDALGGYTLTVETPNSEAYVVAEKTNITSITDAPRWNGVENTYMLTANFDSDLAPNTASTNFVAAPVALEPVYSINNPDWADSDIDWIQTGIAAVSNTMSYIDAMTTPFYANGVDGYTGPTIYGLHQCKDPTLQVRRDELRINFWGGAAVWSFGPYASTLAFVKVEDMGYGAVTTFDADASALYIKVRLADYSNGNTGQADAHMRLAIRNGTDWYVSDENNMFEAPHTDDEIILVGDVAAAGWSPLAVAAATQMDYVSNSVPDTSIFTDINAIGFYSDRHFNSSIREMEIKVSGALDSYDYWADNAGLVSSNSAAGLDPDMDGIINEQEYAYGGDPLVADTAVLPVMDMTVVADPDTAEDAITYVYYKQRDPVSGLTYTLKTTDNLVFGPWSDTGYTAVETDVDYYWTVVTNYIPNAADRTFIKVDVD